MRRNDVSDSVAITREIHWVGFFEDSSKLHCNPYLLVDDEEAILIDPGSIPDFPVVMRKIIDLVNPESITTLIVSHQDPDVCGNLAIVEDVIQRPDLRIAAHTNTLRLIQHQGLKSELYAVDQHDYAMKLAGGREFSFAHLPFLHSPGAIASYDRRTKSLFSGDVFGGIESPWQLFAGENFPENMRSFHEAYMPSNALLTQGMRNLAQFQIERILPQHGSVIEGDQVAVAIEFLSNLPCGIDLMGGAS